MSDNSLQKTYSCEKSTEFGCWTLSDMVDGRYFVVPDYQRGYAWGNRQLEEFWDDLRAVQNSGRKHYTGSITVKEMPGQGEMSRKGFEVVDGQQRLTTMAILLSVLNREANPFVVHKQGGDDYLFEYSPNNVDREFLRRILTESDLPPVSWQNSHQRNLLKAREFFEGKVDELNDASLISDVVMSRLTFDFRIIGSDYDDGVIFETMNNRGKPLTLLEKLKNRLMYLTETLPEEVNEKSALRTKIDESWGHIYCLLASDPSRDPLDEDEFVSAHLSVYRASKESVYSKSVAESRLFKMFCHDAEHHPKSERVDESDRNAVERAKPKEERVSIQKIREYVEDLAAFAEPWAEINSDYDSAVGRCRLLSGTLEVKVFLATMQLHEDQCGEEVLTSIFEKTELILFRNTIQNIMDESALVTMARQIHGKCLDMMKSGEDTQINANDINESLTSIVNNDGRGIDQEKLVEYFAGLLSRQQSPYGFYGWRGLKYFLFKREGDEGLSWNQFEEASLEHIMPQSSTSDNDDGWWVRQMREFTEAAGFGDWQGLNPERRRECRQCKRKLVNSLGNFVLLTQSENASVSDDPWEGYPEVAGVHRTVVGKRAFYSDDNRTSSSGARQVSEIDGSWNAFHIRKRGRDLFRSLANMLGVVDANTLSDEECDSALGFNDEDAPGLRNLADTVFDPLPEDEVNQLAPRIGTAAEPRQERRHNDNANTDNIAFWQAFKDYCLSHGHQWCEGSIHPQGRSYYHPQGANGLHLFFTIGEKAGNIKRQGLLVTVGIYCTEGETQREQIFTGCCNDLNVAFADRPFDFQDWKSGVGDARRILFIRRADYRHPTDELFERMAVDYERIRAVVQQHGFLN